MKIYSVLGIHNFKKDRAGQLVDINDIFAVYEASGS
jgi:hypothetical protein